MSRQQIVKLILIAFVIVFGMPGYAQQGTTTEALPAQAPVIPVPADILNRGTPNGSITGYLIAASEFDFKTAAEYLDVRNLPEEVAQIDGAELARQLNHVLSRSVWIDQYTVSESPEGLKGDGLPGYRDELVKINTKEGEVVLLMQRVPRGDGVSIWKLSNRSVALIPELYDEFSYPAWIEAFRVRSPENASFLGLEAFKWFILIAIGLVGWPVFYLMGYLLSRLFSSPERDTYPLVRKVMTGPVVAFAILICLNLTLMRLGIGAKTQVLMEAQTVIIMLVLWLLWSVLNLIKHYKQNKLMVDGRPGAAQLLNPLITFTKITIFLVALLYWLNNLGVNITTLLAGLGVGGLAIALALQKPLEDMMGALTLFSQAPIRVGDLCKYGEIMGVVEDIGLRTTKLRTLTNTVVSIPNARIAIVEIENFSSRTKIRFWPTLRLRYDTSPMQLKVITDKISTMLTEHNRVHDEPIRVRLTEFDDDAILVKVHCFLITTDFPESLEIGEELNFEIMSIVQAAGASFALPGRALYMEEQNPATTS